MADLPAVAISACRRDLSACMPSEELIRLLKPVMLAVAI